ncbi:MAG: site-2 protease family protein [bacterium]
MRDKKQFPTFDFDNFYVLQELIVKYFEIETVGLLGDMARVIYEKENADRGEIQRAFAAAGYKPHFSAAGGRKTCVLVPTRGAAAKSRIKEKRIAWALFVTTLITTSMAGWYFASDMAKTSDIGKIWPMALSYSVCLLLILGSHELAHKWASRRNGIDSSPPFFIPVPAIFPTAHELLFISFGTMGAVIRVKSPMPNRNAAVGLGISGPLAGFLVSLPIMIAGLLMSKVTPIPLHIEKDTIMVGQPLILFLLQRLLVHVPEGYTLNFHPALIASWIGMFVTSLNLIPIGQLDGGHIAHAILGGKRFRILCLVLIGILACMSYFWPGWLLWAVIGYLLTRRGYPKTMNEEEPLTPLSRAAAVAGLLLLIATFMPIPIVIF